MGSSTGCNHKYLSRMLHVWYTYPHLYHENQPNVGIDIPYIWHMAIIREKSGEIIHWIQRFKVGWKLEVEIWDHLVEATCSFGNMLWHEMIDHQFFLHPRSLTVSFPWKVTEPNRKVVFHYPCSGAILNFRWVIVWHQIMVIILPKSPAFWAAMRKEPGYVVFNMFFEIIYIFKP